MVAKRQAAALKEVGAEKRAKRNTTFKTVIRASMKDHFIRTAVLGKVFAVKRSAVYMENVETLLDTPFSKRAKRLDDVAADRSLAPELEESAVADELVYLQLVMAAPGSKKTLTPTPGAGTYVDTKAVAVTVHRRLNELTAGYPIVSGASTAAAWDPRS